MENNLEIIAEIRDKINRLKAENKKLTESMSDLENKVKSLQDDVTLKDNELQSLLKKWESHQSEDVEQKKIGNEGVQLTKEEMETMVNEIDKCIALLKDKNE